MALRIAVDLDGTLADMDAALQQEAERLFGPLAESADVAEPGPAGQAPVTAAPGIRLSDRQQRRLWTRVREIENFWFSLPEIEPGAVARLAAAAAAHEWDVLFITTRPSSAGETTQLQSQRWLQAHGFELPSVYVVSGSRGRIATALTLDAVIDDRPENCLDVATDSNATPILVWRDSPDAVPPGARRLGIQVVHSIAEALQHLESAAEGNERPGIMGRLRAMLGA
jgi:hypothetical protein